jgi:hypothetical protein
MQDFLAILIALAAAAFLGYRGWQHFAKRRSGCGACSKCPTSESATPSSLVTISPIKPHAKP